MTYRIAAMPMTLSVRQGHSPIVSLFKWDFSYNCAADDKILIAIARRALLYIAKIKTLQGKTCIDNNVNSFYTRCKTQYAAAWRFCLSVFIWHTCVLRRNGFTHRVSKTKDVSFDRNFGKFNGGRH